MFGWLSSTASRFPTASDFGYAELRGGGTRVVIVPALGGKIAEMELAGRQWLWRSDVIPYAPGEDGASYVETADTGGYDECFPTVGECRVPTWVRDFGGVTLPDHGELWSQAPEIDVRTSADGQVATTQWTGRRLPYRFSREVRVSPDGAVHMRYEVVNVGSERIPFLWSSHPLLPLTPDTRLDLPPASRLHVYAQHEIKLGTGATDSRWPLVRVAGKLVDLSRPYSVARRYACKVFLDLLEGHAAVEESGARLEVEFALNEVPNFGLWINRGGWSPFRRGKPYMNLAFEPCIGAPDRLDEALGAWKSAHWLDAGDTRRWSLAWRGRKVEPPASELADRESE